MAKKNVKMWICGLNSGYHLHWNAGQSRVTALIAKQEHPLKATDIAAKQQHYKLKEVIQYIILQMMLVSSLLADCWPHVAFPMSVAYLFSCPLPKCRCVTIFSRGTS